MDHLVVPKHSSQVAFVMPLGFCCCSFAKLGLTLCDPMDCSTPGFTVLHHLPSLLKFMSLVLVVLSNHLILCRPLLLLPLVFPSIRGFLVSCLFTPTVLELGLQYQPFQ